MAQPRPWLDEIIDTLKELGGNGTLADISDRVLERNVMDFNINKHWKDGIRGTIYQYSSDSDYFKGDVGSKKDIFFAVNGKGQGHWGLRDFQPSGNNVDLTEDDLGFVEGKKKLRQHIFRERNPKVIRMAKERFKDNHAGRLFCEICDFDFYERYGEIGEDFIEGHHTIPVSELVDGQKTRVEDIAIVCSNCHRMLHRKRPWLNKEQLKGLLKSKKTISS
jgi:putative restriction endonuclease